MGALWEGLATLLLEPGPGPGPGPRGCAWVWASWGCAWAWVWVPGPRPGLGLGFALALGLGYWAWVCSVWVYQCVRGGAGARLAVLHGLFPLRGGPVVAGYSFYVLMCVCVTTFCFCIDAL